MLGLSGLAQGSAPAGEAGFGTYVDSPANPVSKAMGGEVHRTKLEEFGVPPTTNRLPWAAERLRKVPNLADSGLAPPG